MREREREREDCRFFLSWDKDENILPKKKMMMMKNKTNTPITKRGDIMAAMTLRKIDDDDEDDLGEKLSFANGI